MFELGDLIKDDWVAAVEPQPRFALFFRWDCQVRGLSGGSDGDRFRVFYHDRVHPAFPSPIYAPNPQPVRDSRRGVSSVNTRGTEPALAG